MSSSVVSMDSELARQIMKSLRPYRSFAASILIKDIFIKFE